MSLAVKPVEVVVLEQVKLNKKKIWVATEAASDNAEAIIRHVSANSYVLEVKKRGASNPAFKFDFLKIRSYRMKTNSWHELKYDGDKKYALRFTEYGTNFQSFFEQLQRVLTIHNKPTKPKYNADFMKEVKMFRLEMLTPVDKSNKGRRTSNTDSGVSAGSGASSSSSTLPLALPVGSNCSCESFASKTLHHFGVNKRPQPQIPPKKQQPVAPPPRNNSNDGRNVIEDWHLPSERHDSTDDEAYSDTTSSLGEGPFYSASEHYSTGSSSTADFTDCRPSPVGGDRPPPVPQRKIEGYVNMELLGLDKLKRAPPPPPSGQRSQNISLVRTRSDMPSQTTGAQARQSPPSIQRQVSLQDPSSSSTVYGMAQSWRCIKCSLINRALTVRCAACNWTRTDAWECRGCSIVYSVDVAHCHACPAWRCRLCTFVNSGTNTATPVCDACFQK